MPTSKAATTEAAKTTTMETAEVWIIRNNSEPHSDEFPIVFGSVEAYQSLLGDPMIASQD
jgi:hypothetical protein